MSYYQRNKEASKTRNTDPTLTDQSAAREADINVIVGRFTKTGMVPVAKLQPMAGDYSQLPTDLRGFIETARGLHDLRRKLPLELRDHSIEKLLALTPDELTKILTPPAPKQDEVKE